MKVRVLEVTRVNKSLLIEKISYYPQKRFLFIWWNFKHTGDSGSTYTVSFGSIDDAKNFLIKKLKYGYTRKEIYTAEDLELD